MDYKPGKPLDELRRIWSSTSDDRDATAKFEREEALWEYWKRTANGEQAVEERELETALSIRVRGIGNVVGELARQDRLSPRIYTIVKERLEQTSADDAEWGLVQMQARLSLNQIKNGEQGNRRDLLENLLKKGVSWATLLVIPYLSKAEVEYVEGEVLRRKVFSRAQTEEVRRLCIRRR